MSEIAKVISFALVGKYNDLSEPEIYDIIKRVKMGDDLDKQRSEDSFEEFYQDIVNQIRCMEMIDTQWYKQDIDISMIWRLNAYSRGLHLHDVESRTHDDIPDYEGRIPTKSEDIKSSITLLENSLEELQRAVLENNTNAYIARHMAKIFALIIRIHPFEDGNGRTARFMIQLVNRKLNKNYMVIPKYRNDKVWAETLNSAVKGDLSLLTEYFLVKLDEDQ